MMNYHDANAGCLVGGVCLQTWNRRLAQVDWRGGRGDGCYELVDCRDGCQDGHHDGHEDCWDWQQGNMQTECKLFKNALSLRSTSVFKITLRDGDALQAGALLPVPPPWHHPLPHDPPPHLPHGHLLLLEDSLQVLHLDPISFSLKEDGKEVLGCGISYFLKLVSQVLLWQKG